MSSVTKLKRTDKKMAKGSFMDKMILDINSLYEQAEEQHPSTRIKRKLRIISNQDHSPIQPQKNLPSIVESRETRAFGKVSPGKGACMSDIL